MKLKIETEKRVTSFEPAKAGNIPKRKKKLSFAGAIECKLIQFDSKPNA